MKPMYVRLPALPLAGGAVAGVLFVSGQVPEAIVSITILLISSLISYYRSWYGISMSLGACLAAGALTFHSMPRQLAPELFAGDSVELSGRIVDIRTGNASRRAIVEVDSCDGSPTAQWRLSLMIPDMSPTLFPHDRLNFKASPVPTDRYADVPFMGTTRAYTLPNSISAEAVVHPEEISSVRHAENPGLMAEFRENILRAIFSSELSPAASSLLAGAWLGGDNASPGVRDRFRAVGLSHLLCVSGYHVAVVSWLVALALFPLRLWTRRGRIRYAFAIAAIWCYAALAGFSPSVLRASVMVTAFLAGRLFDRPSSPVNSLLLALAAVLFVNPLWLYSIGLQLSFSAVAALIVFADKLNPVSRRRPRLRNLFSAISVPVAATLGTAPVLLFHFHTLPLATIPVNIIATAVFPLFMVGGAVVVALNAIGLSTTLLSRSIDFLYNILDKTGETFGAIPSAHGIYLTATSLIALTAAILCLGLLLHASSARRRYAAITGCCLCLGTAACSHGNGAADSIAVLHSSRKGVFVSIVDDGKGYLLPASQGSGRREVLSDFFEGHGIAREDVVHISGNFSHNGISRHGDTITLRGTTILLPRHGTLMVDDRQIHNLQARAVAIRFSPSLK